MTSERDLDEAIARGLLAAEAIEAYRGILIIVMRAVLRLGGVKGLNAMVSSVQLMVIGEAASKAARHG